MPKRKFSGSSEKSRKLHKSKSVAGLLTDDSAPRTGVTSTTGDSSKGPSIPTSTKFVNLLDMSGRNTASSIQVRFDEIAKEILHHLLLILRNVNGIIATFEVLELEFYLWKARVHEDPFTHRSAEQSRSGNWYFHRVPQKSNDPEKSSLVSTRGYRGGTRKGLDITIGPSIIVPSPYFSALPAVENSAPSSRGGILIRTLRNTSTGQVISGPSLVVDEILKLSCATSILDLVEKHWMGEIFAFREYKGSVSGESILHFMLKSDAEVQTSYIYQSPRIGLLLPHPSVSLSFDDPRVIFLCKPYRYFIHPECLTSNGRPQTFLGILQSLHTTSVSPLSLDERETKKLIDNICSKSGLKAHTATKYLEYYLGRHGHFDLKFFVGTARKDAPSTYLQLMGILFDEISMRSR